MNDLTVSRAVAGPIGGARAGMNDHLTLRVADLAADQQLLLQTVTKITMLYALLALAIIVILTVVGIIIGMSFLLYFVFRLSFCVR